MPPWQPASRILVEPFTGQMLTHEGKHAIKASLVSMWVNRAPDKKIMLVRVDLQGTTVRAKWTCTSSIMRGYDLSQIKGGKINRMEMFVTEMPQMPQFHEQ